MTKSTHNRRNTVIITVVIILAIAIATIFIFRGIYGRNQSTEPTNSSQDTITTDTTQSSQVTPPDDDGDDDAVTESDTTTPEDGTPIQYEGSNPNDSTTIAAVLTYYGVQNGEYIVNIDIPQYLSGTCQINLGGYSATVSIDQNAASSACSFHIPTTQLQSGLQSLKVNIQSSAATGKIEETIDVSL